MPVRSQPRRPPWGVLVVGLLLLALAAVWRSRLHEPVTSEPGVAQGVVAPVTPSVDRASAPLVRGQVDAEAEAPPAVLPSDGERAHLLEVQNRLNSYRRYAQYPPESRPASEQPDQMTPRAPVVRTQPLSGAGRISQDVRVQLGQDRRELVGDESARLSVRCEDSLGKALPCVIEQAVATSDPSQPAAGVPSVPVTFVDDGSGADAQAGDGTQTALLQPAALGFARYHGLLRVQTTIRIGRETGTPFFDLLYTGTPPARFTGAVNESLVDGSLRLAVGMQVQRPGRYFVIGRVEDATGSAVAYLEWSGELAAGEGHAPLVIFGKLVRDQRPTLPLVLRDVEGYLFLADVSPDRAHMPRLSGSVHKTAVRSLSDFSDREWDSEQKRRYLDEFEKDVQQARREAGSRP